MNLETARPLAALFLEPKFLATNLLTYSDWRWYVRCYNFLMELDPIISFVQGWAFLLGAFFIALGYGIFRGRQALMNLIVGAYIALLLYQLFPAKAKIEEATGSNKSEAIAFLALFVLLAVFAAWLFARLMPSEFLEGAFESMGKKILLAIAATVLVMTLTVHYLPIGELISTGTPLPTMLLTEKLAYLWLVAPLAILFII